MGIGSPIGSAGQQTPQTPQVPQPIGGMGVQNAAQPAANVFDQFSAYQSQFQGQPSQTTQTPQVPQPMGGKGIQQAIQQATQQPQDSGMQLQNAVRPDSSAFSIPQAPQAPQPMGGKGNAISTARFAAQPDRREQMSGLQNLLQTLQNRRMG